MAKRKIKKSSVNPKDAVRPENQIREATVDERDEQKVDYGGLPERDLKKNLGCG